MRARALAALPALACCGALVLSSCAAPLTIGRSVDPLALLAPGELAYLRMDGDSARLLAPALLPAGEGRSLAPLLDRTTSLAFALGLPTPKGSPFDAVFLGSYPFRSASLALGGNRAWKREGEGFFNAAEGIRVALPGPQLVLATTDSLAPFLARARNPGSSPLPPKLAALGDRELLVWIPEPFSGLAESLYGLKMDVPAEGLLLFASRSPDSKTGDPSYDLAAVFLMRDAQAARVYRPLLRLAWYGLARYLLGDTPELLLQAEFSLDGELYRSTAVKIPAAVLASALSRIGGLGAGRTE